MAGKTDQVLQLTGPQSVIFVEGVLINHGLQTCDLLFLSNDLLGDIVKHRLHCESLVRQP